MVTLQPFWEADPVEYLVRWKFPKLPAFGPAAIRTGPPLSEEGLSALLDQAQAYREELWATCEADIELLVAEARQDETRRRNERVDRLISNGPDVNADFAHWASASYWTFDEATALSFGKDPRVVTWAVVSPYVSISPFAKAFEARRDLIHRAGFMGELKPQTPPSTIIAWAEQKKIPMAAELVDAVKALGNRIADWKTLYDEVAARADGLKAELNKERAAHVATLNDHTAFISRMRTERDKLDETYKKLISVGDERIAHQKVQIQDLTKRIAELKAAPPANEAKPLHTRERDSLLKLIIGMAIGGYGFNPQTTRSPTAKDIADDLARAGLSLDQDTVRKYLAEAKELLPGDETEQNR